MLLAHLYVKRQIKPPVLRRWISILRADVAIWRKGDNDFGVVTCRPTFRTLAQPLAAGTDADATFTTVALTSMSCAIPALIVDP